MILLVVAVYAVAVPSTVAVVLFGMRHLSARFGTGDFSWVRYSVWIACAVIVGVGLVLVENEVLFAFLAVLLALVVLLRAALDHQATGLREKVGFLQLYVGLSFVELRLLGRAGLLAGTGAAAPLSFEIHDVLGHVALPFTFLVPSNAPAWALPAVVVGAVGSSLSEHVLLACALATFGVTAFARAYFAERTTSDVGLSLLPAETAVAVSFAVLGILHAVVSAPRPAFLVGVAIALLSPFFVAEGLWVIRRFSTRLRIRDALVLVFAVIAQVSPGALCGLAVLGLGAHFARLRAFEPILGSVQRSGSRPRLRIALTSALGSAFVLALLAAADADVLRRNSSELDDGPEICAKVTLTSTPGGIRVDAPSAHFLVDQDETDAKAGSLEALTRACAAKGERACTSDEWALACVCSYPNESEGGPKLFSNTRLVYRVERDRVDPPASYLSDVHALLSGKAELVAPSLRGGGVLVAGPSDALADDWATDCRQRAFLTEAALATSPGALVAARCCK